MRPGRARTSSRVAPVCTCISCRSTMALKSYHRETLNDNWFEERAEPLNGVLPHDGAREYSTTTKADFAGANALQSRAKPRMVNERSLGPALLQSAGADISQGFRSALPQPNEEQERRYLETTHRSAFGAPKPNAVTSFHTPAGGPGGRRVERGKAASGAAGEVFKSSTEPQRDTASQRSWLYSSDPLVATMERRTQLTASNDDDNNKLDTPGGEKARPNEPNYRRKSTSVTHVPLNHRGVFMDD